MARFSQYNVFIAAFELGSISAAAQQLNISPSAVSKQISALETHLNVQLFERSNRNIKATESGQRFYLRCKAIVHDVMDAEQSIRTHQGAVSGTLRVTLPDSLMRSGIIQHLTAFTDQYPDVRFDLHASERVLDLHETDMDFAFRLGKLEDHSRLIATPLRQVRPVFCATPAYFSKQGTPAGYHALSDHSLCLLPLSQLSDEVRRFLKDRRITFDQAAQHHANTIETIHHLVLGHAGIGMLLDYSIAADIDRGNLVPLFSDHPLPSKTLHMIFKKNEHRPMLIHAFKEFIKARFNH